MTNKIVKDTIVNWFIIVDTTQADQPLRLAGQRENADSPTTVFISSPLVNVPKDGMVETENSFYKLGTPAGTIFEMLDAYALSLLMTNFLDEQDHEQSETLVH